jgi:hypothetical protein
MNPNDETAIADFLKAGGRVCHVKESVRVTESELLDYLQSCGIAANYSPGDFKAYMCQGKRVSASKLVDIANEQRRSLQLPPFALRIEIRYAGPRATSNGKK